MGECARAFSSNKGQDFKAVLEAVIGVKEPSAQVPAPEKKGYWMLTTIWETDGVSHIESLMHSGGAYPSVENESSLSQILQTRVPQKYYLSPKACLGILRRASVRGKELPPVLKAALERQAAQEESA